MLAMVDHAAPRVLGQKFHRLYPRSQETGKTHRTGLDRAKQRLPTHRVHLRMLILKGIHNHHFRMEIAPEARVEDSVLTLRYDRGMRINEHGAHSIVSAHRRQ